MAEDVCSGTAQFAARGSSIRAAVRSQQASPASLPITAEGTGLVPELVPITSLSFDASPLICESALFDRWTSFSDRA